jgi:ABC-type nitrate/sulfonate/bicarbonate transport system substrate-binding protein
MDRQKQPLIVVGFALAAILAVVALLWPEKLTDTVPDTNKRITLGLALQPTSALAIIAMDQRFFEDEGLQVETKLYPSGKRALREGLVPGEVDVAISADIPVTLLSFEEGQLRILAAMGSTSDVNSVVARRDAGITSPEDLQGKRIATQKASAVHYFMHLFLRKHGLTARDVSCSFMKAEQLPRALVDGTIDAFSMREPYVGEALRLLGNKAVRFSAPGIYPQTDMVVARLQFIQNNPRAITGLMQAFLAAEQFVKDNPEQAVKILARRLGADQRLINQLWNKLHLSVTLHQPLVLLLESQARWAVREGYVDGDEILDYTSLIHLNTLYKLKPEAVTVIR